MIKDVSKSVKAKLLNIAKGQNLDYQQLVTRYLYERLLFRLSKSDYREQFYLKGGALLYAIEKELPRPTKDIDFLGVRIKNDLAYIKNVFSEICQIPCVEDGVYIDINSIETVEITEEKEYSGIRVSLVARLDTIKQVMKLDIGFGDIVTPSPCELHYPSFLESLPQANILAYSLESVVAEKFQAMIDLSEFNSRYKDFYDVYRILSRYTIDDAVLAEAIRATFKNRGTLYRSNHPLFTAEFAKDANRNRQWNNFLKQIKQSGFQDFEVVMDLIAKRLEPLYRTIDKV